jgi:hypothetical protein
MYSAYFLITVYKSNKDVHKGKVPTAKTKDYGMYLLGVFDGAKGQVSDNLLVRTLIPLRNLNNSSRTSTFPYVEDYNLKCKTERHRIKPR